MVRMWVICLYFHRYQGSRVGSPWYTGKIERDPFENYVCWEKVFKEGFKDLFARYFHFFSNRWVFQGDTGVRRMQIRIRLAQDTINHCIEKYYLIPENGGRSLSMDYRGRRFLFNPLVFTNAVLKEYGYSVSFVVGLG